MIRKRNRSLVPMFREGVAFAWDALGNKYACLSWELMTGIYNETIRLDYREGVWPWRFQQCIDAHHRQPKRSLPNSMFITTRESMRGEYVVATGNSMALMLRFWQGWRRRAQ